MADKFSNLETLKQYCHPSDYRVRALHRNSPVAVISIHGGYIEPGTSAIARAVAGMKYNHFDFQCLNPKLGNDMHITSTHFREPALTKMLKSSRIALSVHGLGRHKKGNATIWLGGRNRTLKTIMLGILRNQGFHVDPNSPRYRGEDPDNVVNLSCEQGVQLEISDQLRARLFIGVPFHRHCCKLKTTRCFDMLVNSLRLAARIYLQTSDRPVAYRRYKASS